MSDDGYYERYGYNVIEDRWAYEIESRLARESGKGFSNG
jgi:hypothetical protein